MKNKKLSIRWNWWRWTDYGTSARILPKYSMADE